MISQIQFKTSRIEFLICTYHDFWRIVKRRSIRPLLGSCMVEPLNRRGIYLQLRD